jgi:hypothetical protein
MALARRLFLAAALLAAGCTLATEFWKDDEATPVQSFGAPSGFQRSGFGTLVAALQVDVGGELGPSTFVAASAGVSSGTETYRWATRDGLRSDPHLTSLCSPLSDLVDEAAPDWGNCEDSGSGAALLWLPEYRFPGETAACLGTLLVGQPLAAEFGAGRVAVHCPANGRTIGIDRGTSGSDNFGRALALVPAGGNYFVCFGGRGAVWTALYDTGTHGLGPLLPVDTASVATTSFGLVLAGGRTTDGGGWLAVGASTLGREETDVSRLVLLRPEIGGEFGPVGCLEQPAHSALGSALAAADLDGDGNDELLYRSGAGDVGILDGAPIGALTGSGADPRPCAFDEPFAAPLACPTTGEYGIDCSEEYGTALAAGDLDLDGELEVLVGDPGATVSGEGRAGAVHVFKRDGTTWSRVGALFDASPGGGARMGASISVGLVGRRPEPFVGSAGSGEVFVFYCSGLDGDVPRAPDALNPGRKLDDRCLEQAP